MKKKIFGFKIYLQISEIDNGHLLDVCVKNYQPQPNGDGDHYKILKEYNACADEDVHEEGSLVAVTEAAKEYIDEVVNAYIEWPQIATSFPPR